MKAYVGDKKKFFMLVVQNETNNDNADYISQPINKLDILVLSTNETSETVKNSVSGYSSFGVSDWNSVDRDSVLSWSSQVAIVIWLHSVDD